MITLAFFLSENPDITRVEVETPDGIDRFSSSEVRYTKWAEWFVYDWRRVWYGSACWYRFYVVKEND